VTDVSQPMSGLIPSVGNPWMTGMLAKDLDTLSCPSENGQAFPGCTAAWSLFRGPLRQNGNGMMTTDERGTCVAALLFDLDGTILDTTDLIVASFMHTFEVGLDRTMSREELMTHFGRPLTDQFRLMCPDLDDDGVHRLIATYVEHNEAAHDQWVTVVPGADTVLHHLATLGHTLAIVTSKRESLARHGLALFGLEDLFSVIVHSDSTAHHKPHPEPVQYALRCLQTSPKTAVYVGDSPYDMASGHAAGVRTLGLIHNTFTTDQLWSAGADDVVSNWSDIEQILLEWATGPASNPIR